MSEHPVRDAGAPALRVRFDDAIPVLEIPDALAFEELRTLVRASLGEHLPDINGRASRLDIGERALQLFDLRRLIHLLRDEFSVEVTGLYVRPDAIHRYAERELKLKLFPTDARPTVLDEPLTDEVDAALDEVEPELDDVDAPDDGESSDEDAPIDLPSDLTPADLDEEPPEAVDPAALDELACEAPRRTSPDQGSRTLTVHRTLRSGSVVRFDGDVIVFGDVNPGANVIATGKVVVLGALKGMAHAGALGDEEHSILAFDFRPTQVRIGRKIAIPPKATKSAPELALVRDGDIVIEPYTGRYR
jgi:septum site-determining protein MinC